MHRYYLEKTYGPVDYAALLERQGGACAICLTKPKKKRLAVDHCHKTGQVRGLLCGQCNFALGAFQDNRETIQSAIAYLERPPNLENSPVAVPLTL